MDGNRNLTAVRDWRESGVTLVIPALDEEATIEATILAARGVFEGMGLQKSEILVVDDGSTDRTSEIAQRAGAVVYRHPHNVGYGRSLKDGIAHAKYDTIVISDADGTYPLEHVPALLERYERGFDMVVGERSGKSLNQTVVKGPLRRILRFLVEYSAGRNVPDVNSGLRVFSRSTLMEYFPHLCDTFSFTTSATLAYMMTGRFVAYEPIGYRDRVGTTKVRLWRESARTLTYIVQAIIYYNPLKLFLLMSILCFAGAVVIIALAVVFQVVSGFLLGVGTILVGLIVFALGLLADLLRQIMSKPKA